mgnify:CR=1 FL=1
MDSTKYFRATSTVERCALILIGISAALTSVLGLFVMAGHLIKNESWVQLGPHFVPMVFNTALCFVLSGAALFGKLFNKESWASKLSILALVLSLMVLAQFPLHISFGIDTFFLAPIHHKVATIPGRMAIPTCVGFIGMAVRPRALARGI